MIRAYINATTKAVTRAVIPGSNLNYPNGWAFKKPASGNIEIPVNATTGWTIRSTGGDPAASLSVQNISERNAIAKIGSKKSIRFVTGVTGNSSNQAIYTLPDPIPLDDFLNYNLLLWVKVVDGSDISAFTTVSGLYLYARTDNSNFYSYLLGGLNTQYASGGWYAFSLAPSKKSSTTGTPTVINSLSVVVSKNVTDNPIVEIGMITLVPKMEKTQVCILCDGGYLSHKIMADLLTANGMNATFYIAEDTHDLSIGDLLTMQGNGHLIANYVRNWGDGTDLSGRAAKIIANQSWLAQNGFAGGRHLVHGITSIMTEELWEGIIPKYADTITYGESLIYSPFQKTHIGRYHEFTSANKAAIITMVNQALTDGGRLGVLCHDLTGDNYTAFEDFVVNTLKPLQDSGDIEVINAEQSFRKAV